MIGGFRNTSRYLLAGASVIGLFAVGLPEANAQQDLKAIQSQIDSLQATVRELQKQVRDAESQAAAAQTAANVKGSDLDLKVKWRGAPEFSSADEKKFKFKVRGRVETDYNAINQDTRTTFAPDVSATELRRARIGVEGVAFYDVKYIFEVDFGSNDAVSVKDAYIQYTGLPVYFTAGNFKTYNSLEEATSGNYTTFLERAAFIEAFALDRQIGFGASYFKDHFTLAAGIFGEGPAAAPLFSGFTGDENLTFASRGTVAPINREVNGVNQVLHFGASVRTRETGDDQPYLQYQARGADLHLANRFVNTGRIGESDTFWGLEAAGVWGPLSVQSEYGQTEVELPSTAFLRTNPPQVPPKANNFLSVPDPTYNGWYVDAGWFLTGETRPYKDGVFQRVKVKNPVTWSRGSGWGAWQIAGRYDVIDLSDDAFNNAGGCPATALFPGVNATGSPTPPANASIAQCGEQKTWLVAVNWYLNDYVKLMFNYTESDLSGYPVTALTGATAQFPANTRVAGFDDAKIRGFGMRAHIDW